MAICCCGSRRGGDFHAASDGAMGTLVTRESHGGSSYAASRDKFSIAADFLAASSECNNRQERNKRTADPLRESSVSNLDEHS